MPHLLVNHRVEDYDTWRDAFDANAHLLAEYGCRGGRVFRASNNPHRVAVLLDWAEAEDAREFVASDSLGEVMATASVVGEPDVTFLEEGAAFDLSLSGGQPHL